MTTTAAAALQDLGLEFRLLNQGLPLRLGAMEISDGAGEKLSITRADFLLSGFALQRLDGSWLESANWFAVIRPGEGVVRARVEGVPVGSYQAVRWVIGLDEATDHADPNAYPPDHPLNAQVNGLHWGWQSGYVFMALEGHRGQKGGFSYHLAGAENRMGLELPVKLNLPDSGTLQVDFDVAAVFGKLELAKVGDSTHSRDQDPRAKTVREQVVKAFKIGGMKPELYQNVLKLRTGDAKPKVGTPYPLPVSQRFPQVLLSATNEPTVEGVALGQRLFQDGRLSKNDQQSCATCHDRSHAFTDHGRRFSVGVNGEIGTRNAMPLFNLLWQKEFFWDGRAASLHEQALIPIEDPHEMAETLPNVMVKLGKDAKYPAQFAAAFGSQEITPERLGKALEQFLSTLISQDSKFDRALRKEEKLTASEQRGLQLFLMEYDPPRQLFGADCFHCHGGNLFSNQGFANNGLDAVPLSPGRAAVTKLATDEGKFRVPSLRNVALTAPYMHDGRFATLEEVIAHYDHGVKRSATLDPNLAKHPEDGLKLSAEDQRALRDFLNTLTDEAFAKP